MESESFVLVEVRKSVGKTIREKQEKSFIDQKKIDCEIKSPMSFNQPCP